MVSGCQWPWRRKGFVFWIWRTVLRNQSEWIRKTVCECLKSVVYQYILDFLPLNAINFLRFAHIATILLLVKTHFLTVRFTRKYCLTERKLFSTPLGAIKKKIHLKTQGKASWIKQKRNRSLLNCYFFSWEPFLTMNHWIFMRGFQAWISSAWSKI